MFLANEAIRKGLKSKVEAIAENGSEELKAAAKEYLDTFTVGALTVQQQIILQLNLRS